MKNNVSQLFLYTVWVIDGVSEKSPLIIEERALELYITDRLLVNLICEKGLQSTMTLLYLHSSIPLRILPLHGHQGLPSGL